MKILNRKMTLESSNYNESEEELNCNKIKNRDKFRSKKYRGPKSHIGYNKETKNAIKPIKNISELVGSKSNKPVSAKVFVTLSLAGI